MNYSDEYQVVWLTPIRTAARVCRSLMKNLGFIYEGHTLLIPSDKENYDLILNIRNPYPRMVSIFMLYSLHNKNFELNFEDFILSFKNLQHLYQLSLDETYLRFFDKNPYFIRTEFLHQDLTSIAKFKNKFIEMGETYNNIVLDNIYSKEFEDFMSRPRTPWQNFYNQDIADKVLSLTEKQFELFNYNKDYWKDGTP